MTLPQAYQHIGILKKAKQNKTTEKLLKEYQLKVKKMLKNTKIYTGIENYKPTDFFLKSIRYDAKYTGISWCKKNEVWVVRLNVDKKQKYIGASTELNKALSIRDNYLATL